MRCLLLWVKPFVSHFLKSFITVRVWREVVRVLLLYFMICCDAGQLNKIFYA